MNRKEVGKLGEEFARNYLENKGYQILEANWRHGKAEVDLIARHGRVLVFVEIKTRTSTAFGRPEEFLSPKQEALLSKAAARYMDRIGHQWEIRFDVVSINLEIPEKPEITHLRDAFFPGLH
jgi:putative endonuclease